MLRFIFPLLVFYSLSFSPAVGMKIAGAKECSELSSLIFLPKDTLDTAVELAAECKDTALAHSYLQSALVGVFMEQAIDLQDTLGVPDSDRTADSFYKAFMIRRLTVDGAMEPGDEARRTYTYLFESAKRGSLYGSAYTTYMGLFKKEDWAGTVIQNIEPFGVAHLSAVKQLVNHLNTSCFYSTKFPSKNPPAPEPLVLDHYWQTPEFSQMLMLLRENECDHVESFISKNALNPEMISGYFLTELRHQWELENIDDLTMFKLKNSSNQYSNSEIPTEVLSWVERYKELSPENPLNWCDENQADNLNLCYRLAFFDDFYCSGALSVDGFSDRIQNSAEYDYCRGTRFFAYSGVLPTGT